MHIAIIRQQYTPYGGAERFVSNALTALSAHASDAIEASLISRKWHDLDHTCTNLHLIQCDPAYFPKTNLRRDQTFAQGVRRILEKNHFDLSQTHERIPGCDIFRAGDGVHATWLEARKRIASPWKRLGFSLNAYHRYLLATERKLFTDPSLKAVICNSTMVKTDIQKRFGTPEEKLHVIYNGYDPTYFSPELVEDFRPLMRKSLGIESDQSVFLFVGSGFERKGLAQAIQTLRNRPKALLIVVGHDKNQTQYQQLAHDVCPGRVRFVGPTTDVRPYYGAADALFLPTLYDPFPNVIFEAMACQLPVITSTHCGAQDMIRSGEEGFICDPLDISAMEIAVDKLQDPEFRQEAGKRARHRIAPYTTKTMADCLSRLYARLLDPATAHPRPSIEKRS